MAVAMNNSQFNNDLIVYSEGFCYVSIKIIFPLLNDDLKKIGTIFQA